VSSRSTRPYLGRALWEWCSDQGYTPLIQVQVDERTRVPAEFVQDGQVVLNLSASATRNLTMNNDEIRFSARFNGISHEISVPWPAVLGLFSRETGEGMVFGAEPQEEIAETENGGEALPSGGSSEAPAEPPKKPTLTVVK
jgi:stringent starvation protein B